MSTDTGDTTSTDRTRTDRAGAGDGGLNVLWVLAHPEPRSLNGALRDEGVRTLRELGHRVRESDLYAMGWNPLVTAADYGHDPRDRLMVGAESERAHARGALPADVRAEQEKIAWADALVLQFPLWWAGVPAILKGWFDRVLVQGFAFGLTGAGGRTLRYGEGGLGGKRALVITTVGARSTAFGPRGVHGEVEEVLFPLLHGILWYTGAAALPPLMVSGADRLTGAGYDGAAAQVRERLAALPHAAPLPYRPEHGGGYDDELVLRPHLASGRTGVGIHLREAPAAAPA